MASPLLALFVRSLSEEARQKSTYWYRGGLCSFALIFILIAAVVQSVNATGLVFFGIMAFLQLVAISVIGLSHFGSAIAEEKEEQTLGLLRMTDLNAVSILLGKSTSRLLGALLLLITALPFTVLSVTLGGISLRQILAAYCILGAYTFLLANVALLGSVVARNTTGAAIFGGVVTSLLMGCGPMVESFGSFLRHAGISSGLESFGKAWWDVTPIARLSAVLETSPTGSLAGWPESGNLILGLVFFLLAWSGFNSLGDRGPIEAGSSGGRKRRLFGMRLGETRPTTNPVFWKDYHFLHGGKQALVLRIIGYLALPAVTLGMMMLFYSSPASLASAGRLFETWLTLFFVIDVGFMAARMFRTEITDQTLSALATLPASLRRTAWCKANAFLLMVAPGTISAIGLRIFPYWEHVTSWPSHPSLEFCLRDCVEFVYLELFFISLTVTLSLLMKRGALAVGIFSSVTLFVLFEIAPSLLFRNEGIQLMLAGLGVGYAWIKPALGIGFCTLATLFMLRWCARRLEALAGEE